MNCPGRVDQFTSGMNGYVPDVIAEFDGAVAVTTASRDCLEGAIVSLDRGDPRVLSTTLAECIELAWMAWGYLFPKPTWPASPQTNPWDPQPENPPDEPLQPVCKRLNDFLWRSAYSYPRCASARGCGAVMSSGLNVLARSSSPRRWPDNHLPRASDLFPSERPPETAGSTYCGEVREPPGSVRLDAPILCGVADVVGWNRSGNRGCRSMHREDDTFVGG